MLRRKRSVSWKLLWFFSMPTHFDSHHWAFFIYMMLWLFNILELNFWFFLFIFFFADLAICPCVYFWFFEFWCNGKTGCVRILIVLWLSLNNFVLNGKSSWHTRTLCINEFLISTRALSLVVCVILDGHVFLILELSQSTSIWMS